MDWHAPKHMPSFGVAVACLVEWQTDYGVAAVICFHDFGGVVVAGYDGCALSKTAKDPLLGLLKPDSDPTRGCPGAPGPLSPLHRRQRSSRWRVDDEPS